MLVDKAGKVFPHILHMVQLALGEPLFAKTPHSKITSAAFKYKL